MRAFSAVAIEVFTVVFIFFHCRAKPTFGFVDVIGNLG
jgi:hypothetical protein